MDYPKRKNNRIRDYDYSQNGAYFVTICTEGRRNLLSVIVGEGLCALPRNELSVIGGESKKSIKYINENNKNIIIDKYVIMPNHIHMIVMINNEEGENETHAGGDGTPPLQYIIGRLKSYTTQRYNEINSKKKNNILWQRSFHDHIIRNEQDYLEIWDYIDTNLVKWAEDKYFE
jgi:putative transposase